MVPVVLLGRSAGQIIDLPIKQEVGTENQSTVPKDSWQPQDSVEIGKKHSPVPAEKPGGCKKDKPGAPGHTHWSKKTGQFHKKRCDTHLSSAREKDKLHFPWLIPPDTHIEKLREVCGVQGLHKLSAILHQFELCGQLRERLLQHGITPVKIPPT